MTHIGYTLYRGVKTIAELHELQNSKIHPNISDIETESFKKVPPITLIISNQWNGTYYRTKYGVVALEPFTDDLWNQIPDSIPEFHRKPVTKTIMNRKKVRNMDPLVYRARGIYNGTGNEVYLTNVWRRTLAEAESDIRVYGKQHYTKCRIVKLNKIDYANKHHRLPHMG